MAVTAMQRRAQDVPAPADESARSQLALEAYFLMGRVLENCDHRSRVYVLFDILRAKSGNDDFEPSVEELLECVRAFYRLNPDERTQILNGWPAHDFIVGDAKSREVRIENDREAHELPAILMEAGLHRIDAETSEISINAGRFTEYRYATTAPISITITEACPKDTAIDLLEAMVDHLQKNWEQLMKDGDGSDPIHRPVARSRRTLVPRRKGR